MVIYYTMYYFMNLEILGNLGLAKNEAYIYVTLVKYGYMGISSVAKKSGVHRRNVYDSMQRLLEKGLVYEEITNKEHLFHAVEPSKLYEIIEERKEELSTLVPQLQKAFTATVSQDSLTVFSGVEGVKQYLSFLEKSKKEIYVYSAKGSSLVEGLQYSFRRMVNTLEKNKVPVHILYHHSIALQKHIIGHTGKTTKSKVLSEDTSSLGTFTVCGDRVYFESGGYNKKNLEEGGDVTLMMIESRVISEMMKTLFLFAWKETK